MVRTFALAAVRLALRVAFVRALTLGTALALLLGAAQPASAQDVPKKARTLLKAGIDSKNRGDYETASKYFEMAEPLKGELTPVERADLQKLVEQNEVLLKSQREGAAQIEMSFRFLEQGNVAEARKMLRSAETNAYLSPTDRKALADLQKRVGDASAADLRDKKTPSDPVGKDMKSLLGAGRSALAGGDFDKADSLCTQAEKANSNLFGIIPIWSDSPSKLKRDIQAARAKAAPPPVVAEKKESGGPLGFVKGMFAGPKKDDKTPPKEIAKTPDLPKDMGPGITPPPPSDIRTASAGTTAATTRAIQLINEGYAALDRNDVVTAQKLALEAKTLRPDLSWSERNPDRLLADIEARTKAATPPVSPKTTVADAHALVKQARTALGLNQIEEAEKLVIQAAGVTGVRWGLFEDTPDKVRRDIQAIRARHDKEESAKLLTEARSLYQAGNFHEAKLKAWQAQKLHGPYGPFDLGDRPNKLLDEIQRAEKSKGITPEPPAKDGPSSALKPDPTKGVASAIFPTVDKTAPASVVAIDRQKATLLLVEARELQKKGQLVEARAKALEAKKLGVVFGRDEESPDRTLFTLSIACDSAVRGYLKRAQDSAGASDPERFKRAQGDIEAARQLATAFGQDLAEIDSKMLWLQQTALASGAAPLGGMPKTVEAPRDAMTKAGRDKLDHARLELRSGNTVVARRLAEEAYNPMYGVQAEAVMVLRTIDAEEGNQIKLQAERNARAGLEAFGRKDFRAAASILSAIDMRLLSPELYGRIREVMGSAQLALAETGGVMLPVDDKTPGKIDPAVRHASDRGDTAGDSMRAMEKIQFQQLRERTLSVLTQANDLMARKLEVQAMQLLEDHKEELRTAALEPELLAPLKRQVDFRIQSYNTLIAQRKIEGMLTKAPDNPEANRVRAEAAKQKLVKEKLDLANQLMKENKFAEARQQAALAQEIDPDNLTAQYILTTGLTKERLHRHEVLKLRNEDQLFKAGDNEDVGEWPDNERPVRMDRSRLELAKKRGDGRGISAYGKTRFQKSFDEKLHHTVNLDFVNTPLEKVLAALRAETGGVNMVPDTVALLNESISLDQPITCTLENLSLKSALDIILKQAKLTYIAKDDYVSITTIGASKGGLERKVYSVADLIVPVENHPTKPTQSFDSAMMRHIASQSGVSMSPTPVVAPTAMGGGAPVSNYSSGLGSAFGTAGGGSSGGPTPFVVAKSNSGTIEDMLINLITNSVTPDTWNNMGGPGTIQYYPLGMALIINQTPEVQEEVYNLLQALRKLQDLEVAIEMKVVKVSDQFFERIGVDFDVNIRTGTARREPDLLTSNFVPFGFVNRNNDRLGLVSGLTPAGTLTPDLNIPFRGSSFDFSVPPFGGFPGTLGADGGISLGLAFLSDIQVFMFMEAAQGDQRSQVIQAPKITVFNGQTASIFVQDTHFFLTSVQPVQGPGSLTFFTPQNNPFPVGIGLQVNPVVSADRRFVRLNLQPQIQQIPTGTTPVVAQFPVLQVFDSGPGAGATQTTGQPVLFQLFLQQPVFSSIQIDTTVNVPDGGTVVLGGLKTVAEARNEFGPPILSQIPYLNRLFKNVGYGRETTNLMLMVTPRIIINEEEEAIFLGTLEPIPREF